MVSVYDSKIGARIKVLRKAKKMSSDDLAEALSLSTVHMRRIESGAELPGIDTLARMAEVLDVLPSTFLCDNVQSIEHCSYPQMRSFSPDEVQTFIKLIQAFYK